MGITSWTDVNGVPTPVYSSSSTNATAITDNLIVDADVNSAAAIAYSKLALTGHIVNADVAANAAVAYSKLSLGTSIVNADVSTSAAIAYSKLNLGTSILNADIAAAAGIAASKLAAGTSGQALVAGSGGTPAYQYADPHYNLPTGWLAATYDRDAGNSTSVALAGTAGVSVLQSIILTAGMVISNISFMSGGTTALSGGTHQWFFLTDSSRVQLATTTDDTNTAWGTNTVKTLAVAAIASGAAGSYTVPTTGLYYLGYNIQATTLPTGQHQSGLTANLASLAPITAGTSSDAVSSSAAPAFAHTYGALTGVAKILYGGVS